MELREITSAIVEDRRKIHDCMSVVWKLAKKKAEAEYYYKKAYAIEIERLRIEKNPATLIKELAEGEVADKRRDWELAQGQYRAGIASLEALQTSIQALQTMIRIMKEEEGL